jgi:regulator of protease activity HflC (stomatin/prohibitin superfamily)
MIASLSLIFVGTVTSVLSPGLVFLKPLERGVVISVAEGGVRSEALQPGLNWVIPFLENVVIYPIGWQTYTMSIAPEEGEIRGDDSVAARTSDGQVVRVAASVIFSIDPSQVVAQHIKWNGTYIDNLIRPVSRGLIRDAVSQFAIEEVYSTERVALSELIRVAMEQSLEEGGLILHDFTIHEVLKETEYSALLSTMLNEEPIVEEVLPEERNNFIESVRRVLQTLACLALPVTFLAIWISRARRKRISHELGVTQTEHTTQASDGEKASETEALTASSPEENYLLGKSLLGRGERSKAIEAFTAVYRTSKDPILKKEALNQLELLDAVKKL